MKSSYKSNVNFGDLIKTITFIKNPRKIVEFGILDGFSLQSFIEARPTDCIIEAYDIFEDFNGNHANYNDIKNKFKSFKNVTIHKHNLYNSLQLFEDNSIDILHIDIANNGDTYEYIFNNFMTKLTKNGIVLLEGGSQERDKVEWMDKYNKPKIYPIIQKYKEKYNIITIGTFPSITIGTMNGVKCIKYNDL